MDKISQKITWRWLLGCLILLAGCVRNETPQVIVITATFLPPTDTVSAAAPTQLVPTILLSPAPYSISLATPNPTRSIDASNIPNQHTVQAGDTLSGIAQRYNVSLQSVLNVNELENPNVLSVGQVIQLPELPTTYTSNTKLIPDSRLVRAPGSNQFDALTFASQQPGHIRQETDTVSTRLANGANFDEVLTAGQVVKRVSQEYSVDARLLLALLEYRSGWLSNPNLDNATQVYPLISEEATSGFDRAGLYMQLSWAANELNRAYYNWKYDNSTTLEFQDGSRFLYDTGLNGGTVALQYFLSLNQSFAGWNVDISENGFYRTYFAYFGDPFANPIEPLVPNGIQQPVLSLPFVGDDIWYYTGGPHGGWGSGSAWASLDFAPPDERNDGDPFCYISEYPLTAVASGVIARNSMGALVLDLDGDADESTGWTILYLHISADPNLSVGTPVSVGDTLGFASCAGGFSTATHLHIARRYNGEWLPADCSACSDLTSVPPFVMSNWQAIGIAGQEYQGFLQRGSQRAQAEQGRETTINHISQ